MYCKFLQSVHFTPHFTCWNIVQTYKLMCFATFFPQTSPPSAMSKKGYTSCAVLPSVFWVTENTKGKYTGLVNIIIGSSYHNFILVWIKKFNFVLISIWRATIDIWNSEGFAGITENGTDYILCYCFADNENNDLKEWDKYSTIFKWVPQF